MLNGILIGLAVLLSVLAVVRWTARAAAQDERSIRAPRPIRPVSSTRSARPDGPPWRRTSRVAIRPLSPTARIRYTGAWRGAEASFPRAPVPP
jgi:hypothetical protein